MVFPSTGAGLSSLFMTKMQDIDGMNWLASAGCVSVHVRDIDTSGYSTFQADTTLWGGDSVDNSGSIVFVNAASIPNTSPIALATDVLLRSPDDLAIFYDIPANKPLMDIKFALSINCSVWARPSPTTLLNRTGATGLSVASDNYT